MTVGITGLCPLLVVGLVAKVEAIGYCTFIGFLNLENSLTL